MEAIPPLRSNKVLIVGKGSGWDRAAPFLSLEDWNVWAIPQSYGLLDTHRVDLVFEIHDPASWHKKKGRIYNLNTGFTKPKLIVPTRVPGWTNNSYLLPSEELKQLGLPLVNSFAWMVAYAVYRGIDTITFRGVNLDFAKEAELERDGMMFILGYLRAKGINLDTDRSGGLSRGHEIWGMNS